MKLRGERLYLWNWEGRGCTCRWFESVGEMLYLKLLPQFLSHLKETCYTWSLCRVELHGIHFLWGPAERLQSYAPFLKFFYIRISLFLVTKVWIGGTLITISGIAQVKPVYFICDVTSFLCLTLSTHKQMWVGVSKALIYDSLILFKITTQNNNLARCRNIWLRFE